MPDETKPKANHVAGTRRWAGALVLGGALAVLAAALLGLSLRASSSTQAGKPRTEPRTLHPTGDFKHPSGFPMPESVGSFQRVEVTQYDEAGLNLSAGYNRLPGEGDPWPIAATVYVYPVRPGVELDAAFEKLLGDLGRMHGGAKPETLVPPPDEAGPRSHSPSETETPNSPELFASGAASRCLATS